MTKVLSELLLERLQRETKRGDDWPPLVLAALPSTPVVLATPPVIRATRPVMVLVGMAWLGSARTTRWPAARPWLTWV